MFLFVKDLLLGIEGAPIAHVNLWNEQIRSIEGGRPFGLPAVFVEFAPVRWALTACSSYRAPVRVRLHIITDSRLGSPFAAFDTAEAIFEALDGKMNSNLGIGEFVRTGSITDHHFGELRHNIEEYESVFMT